MKIKICGMKYRDNIEAIAMLQPDYLGFIFYNKSARYFDGEIPELPNTIKKVGVFVNAELTDIINKIEKHNLDAVQLHGDESAEFCSQLKRHCEELSEEAISSKEKDCHSRSVGIQKKSRNDNAIEIIKVFSIKDDFNFEKLKPFEAVCDYFLFDTKGELPGGNGFTFNWDVLKKYSSTKPYFLSGGIGLNEIEKIKGFKESPASKYCYAIDVNSKFEIAPGLKNIEELRQFMIK